MFSSYIPIVVFVPTFCGTPRSCVLEVGRAAGAYAVEIYGHQSGTEPTVPTVISTK